MPDTDHGVSTAVVTTDRPARYAKQLVAHLSRRNAGEWVEEAGTGWIDFVTGRAELSSGDGVLNLRVESDRDSLAGFEDVVGRHLVRFGTRDELVVTWVRDDGSPGTEQHNDAQD
jgi:hypothetical protein